MPRRLKHRLRYRVKAVKLNVKDSAAFLAYHVIVPVGSAVEAVGAVRYRDFKKHSCFAELIQIAVYCTQAQIRIVVL